MNLIDNRNCPKTFAFEDIKQMQGNTFMANFDEGEECVIVVTDEKSVTVLTECCSYSVGTILKEGHISDYTTFTPINAELTIS